VALDEERLAIVLDLVEHVRKPPRRLGRSQPSHTIRLSDFPQQLLTPNQNLACRDSLVLARPDFSILGSITTL
jgi:hypothetical protein